MTNPDDRKRAAEVSADRLATRGIHLNGRESSEELAAMQEAVEQFEDAVQSRGGDLMVDEGVPGKPVQPDDPHFALPRRQARESVSDYLARLARATEEVRRHRSLDSPA